MHRHAARRISAFAGLRPPDHVEDILSLGKTVSAPNRSEHDVAGRHEDRSNRFELRTGTGTLFAAVVPDHGRKGSIARRPEEDPAELVTAGVKGPPAGPALWPRLALARAFRPARGRRQRRRAESAAGPALRNPDDPSVSETCGAYRPPGGPDGAWELIADMPVCPDRFALDSRPDHRFEPALTAVTEKSCFESPQRNGVSVRTGDGLTFLTRIARPRFAVASSCAFGERGFRDRAC
jgi:hypothetical protein